ncbi:MAG TPA: phosphoglucosamine mutase [Candidatus Latescibacteria bacterium]|nr:phosphoglucosamine mutase [Candidatus Latescibacterota bacterium]
MKLLISVSGIRGVVGGGLTPEEAAKFGAAFGAWTGGPITFGRDTRRTGEMLEMAATSGMLSVGASVIRLGVVPTPTVLCFVRWEKEVSGGVIVTASHNPIQWNGLKLVHREGRFLTRNEGEAVLKLYREGHPRASWEYVGEVADRQDAIDLHIGKVLSSKLIDPDSIRRRKFKVVLDAVDGAGSEAGVRFLKSLGCDVVELNCTPDGRFPRGPEPVAENLYKLEDLVKESGADVGFGLDPDADRLSLVSEEGKAVGGEYTLALAAKFTLGKRPGPLVVNLSTSRTAEDIAEEFGVPLHRVPVGEVNVLTEMLRLGSPVGGEGNGGVILPEVNYGRDSLVGMALVLQYMAESGKPISELVAELPKYFMLKARYKDPGLDGERAMEKVMAYFEGEEVDTRDGVRVTRDKAWVHVRPSNTEPLVRVIAEAEDEATAEGLVDEVIKIIAGK